MRSSRPRTRGFSLIELMFSMAIGSIILILAATMLGSSGEGYERVGGSVATEREARALLTQLASDLATAQFHKDNLIEKSSASWSADKLGFLSLQPAAAQTDAGRIGDLCAVNYYIKDLTMGGKTVRCLMRGFRESNDTFKALKADTGGTLFSEQPNIDEPIAFGVISFEARPRSRDNTGKWIDWVKNDTTGPEALDVKLVLARRELSGKLKTSADWNGSSGAGSLLGESSKADQQKSRSLRYHPSLWKSWKLLTPHCVAGPGDSPCRPFLSSSARCSYSPSARCLSSASSGTPRAPSPTASGRTSPRAPDWRT